jgi:hypothetical protein
VVSPSGHCHLSESKDEIPVAEDTTGSRARASIAMSCLDTGDPVRRRMPEPGRRGIYTISTRSLLAGSIVDLVRRRKPPADVDEKPMRSAVKTRWIVTAVTVVALSCLAAPSWGTAPSQAEGSDVRAAGPDPVVTEAEAAKAARETGSPVEVLGLRGETREVYAEPAGGFVAVEHLRPVRTLKDGRWVDIDTTLRKEPDGSIRPAATTVDLRLHEGKPRRYAACPSAVGGAPARRSGGGSGDVAGGLPYHGS